MEQLIYQWLLKITLQIVDRLKLMTLKLVRPNLIDSWPIIIIFRVTNINQLINKAYWMKIDQRHNESL